MESPGDGLDGTLGQEKGKRAPVTCPGSQPPPVPADTAAFVPVAGGEIRGTGL